MREVLELFSRERRQKPPPERPQSFIEERHRGDSNLWQSSDPLSFFLCGEGSDFHCSSAVLRKSKFPDGFSSSPCTRFDATITLLRYQRFT